MLPDRKPVAWPQQARVALWVVPALEWFPLNMAGVPFKPPGAMQTAYPDLRHYTLRDYGNRVGIFRIMKALEKHGIRPTVAVNASVAVRYPSLINECTQRGWEIMANGLDMDHLHHGGLAVDDEKKLIDTTLDILRKASGQAVRGWLSPAKSESAATLDLLGAAALPLGLIVAGAGLSFAEVRRRQGTIAAVTLVMLGVMPPLMWLIAWALGGDSLTQGVALICGAAPGSAASYMLARQMGGDAPLIAGIIASIEARAAGGKKKARGAALKKKAAPQASSKKHKAPPTDEEFEAAAARLEARRRANEEKA
jgi:hypothetical protein